MVNRERKVIRVVVVGLVNNFVRVYFEMVMFGEVVYEWRIVLLSNFGIWIGVECIWFFVEKV